MSKRLDPGIKCLMALDRAMMECPSRFWKANIDYIVDAWLTRPKKEVLEIIEKEEAVALEELRDRIRDETRVFTKEMNDEITKLEKLRDKKASTPAHPGAERREG